jgi:hypothetical protein
LPYNALSPKRLKHHWSQSGDAALSTAALSSGFGGRMSGSHISVREAKVNFRRSGVSALQISIKFLQCQRVSTTSPLEPATAVSHLLHFNPHPCLRSELCQPDAESRLGLQFVLKKMSNCWSMG